MNLKQNLLIFKNTEVGRKDIGEYMQIYSIENDLLKHPQQKLKSSFKVENGFLNTPLFNFYRMFKRLRVFKSLPLCIVSPSKCFTKFAQSVVDARSEGDENPLSVVVAETMKLLRISS